MQDEYYKLQSLGIKIASLSKMLLNQSVKRRDAALWNKQLDSIIDELNNTRKNVNNYYLKEEK